MSLLLKVTHGKFNDVVDEIAWDGLAVHFVDYHLLQKKKKMKTIRNAYILPINPANTNQHDVTM